MTFLALLAGVFGAALVGCGNDSSLSLLEAAKVHEEAAASRSPVINTAAPDFTLPDQDARGVTLSKLHGQWVVVYFYPQDDTPGCTCEATEFTRVIEQFRNMKAALYGVSNDSVDTHKFFIAKYKLGLNLLSDRDHKVMSDYGAWVTSRLGEKTYGRVIRSTVLIDPQGIVRYHWPEVIPSGHAERVRAKLAELQGHWRP
jgi:peroxiredoxin Q/BCP